MRTCGTCRYHFTDDGECRCGHPLPEWVEDVLDGFGVVAAEVRDAYRDGTGCDCWDRNPRE